MKGILHAIKEITSFVNTFLILIILFTNAVVMYYSFWYVSQFTGAKYFAIPIFIVIPIPVLITYIVGIQAYVWYIFLGITITISLTLFTLFGLRRYMDEILKSPLSYRTNPVKDFTEMYATVMFLSVVVTLIIKAMGVKTPTIGIEKLPLYAQMLNLLHASFYEEFVVRFLYLGVPVFIWRKYVSKMEIRWYRIFGGGFKIGKIEVVFILLSATIFGIAHTPAWGWWKFFPTFIAGLAMAYLYLRYGMHYSILFHFVTDFMSIPMELSSTAYLTIGFLFMTIILLGMVFTISYTIRLFHRLKIIPKKTNKIEPMRETPWISIKCPSCGSQNFVYLENGRLKCLNCGTVFEPYQEQQNQLNEGHYPK